MERRNTIQRDMVLNAVRSLCNHATADEIYEYIIKEHPSISKGTVYRNLGILAKDGEIRQIDIPGGPSAFDHNTTEHFHVRCVKCHKVFDVDTEHVPDIRHFVSDDHGITLLAYDIMFTGICKSCNKEAHNG